VLVSGSLPNKSLKRFFNDVTNGKFINATPSFVNKRRTSEKELGAKAIRNYMPMQKGDVKITLSDTTLLKKLAGYNPKTNYKVGIKKFLDWYLLYYKK